MRKTYIILAVLIIIILGGVWYGYYHQKKSGQVSENGSALPTSDAPLGQQVSPLTIISGTVKSISGSVAVLDSGWSVDFSGTNLKYPSGLQASASDVKVGANLSVTLNKTQAPGKINSSNIKSIIVVPSNK